MVRPNGRAWEDFINFAAERQVMDGQPLEKFISWVLVNGYDPIYMPPQKLQTLWDRAFTGGSLPGGKPAQRLPSGI